MSERLSDYDFELPEELIAQAPAEPRDQARLLVIDRKTGTWKHRKFSDLTEFMDEQDLLVANNTKVLKARLLGNRIFTEGPQAGREGGKVEFLMLEEKSPRVWEGLFHASAKYQRGLEFVVRNRSGSSVRAKLVSGVSDQGTVLVEFDRDPVEADVGEVPLPKYIKRSATFIPDPATGAATEEDNRDYQTVYSKQLGSAAAPTAGLHFTSQLIERLRAQGVSWAEVTLHVGIGTFRPVKAENITDHVMHEERYEVSEDAARAISSAKKTGKRVTAVGTTSVRTLESAIRSSNQDDSFQMPSGAGRTSIFIRPGNFQFQMVDQLITNFHLPKSSLLMLVSTFAGRELMLAAYNEAVKERYRFYSYGDAMLIV